MVATRLGKLKPRYRFALNPFPDVRWSRCPRCDKLMHDRKFPLLIAFANGTFLAQGKTCRYCTPCELIIAHQHEIEAEMEVFREVNPKVVGVKYMVVGTVERKTWVRSLHAPMDLDELLAHSSDIKHPMIIHDPRCVWGPADSQRKERWSPPSG
jgi:hypothetical protein